MIVQSMTPEEVYREIDQDMSDVSAWWMRERKRLEQIAKWTIKLPRTTWYDHESSRRNRYLVMSIILGRKYNDASVTAVLALQRMERGWAVYFTRWPWQMVANRIVLLPHVFDQYANPERGNVRKTGIALIEHFVERNCHGEQTTDSRFSGRSVRYRDRVNLCASVNDGVLLGEDLDGIFVAHTFITYEMANGLQRAEFEKNREKVLSNREAYEKIREIYGY